MKLSATAKDAVAADTKVQAHTQEAAAEEGLNLPISNTLKPQRLFRGPFFTMHWRPTWHYRIYFCDQSEGTAAGRQCTAQVAFALRRDRQKRSHLSGIDSTAAAFCS